MKRNSLMLLIMLWGLNMQAQNPGSGWYYVQSKISELNLDCQGGNTDVNGLIVQGKPHPSQVWRFVKAEGEWFYIESKKSQLDLYVYGESDVPGARVTQAKRDNRHVWKLLPAANLNGYYYIQSKVSKLYLDIGDNPEYQKKVGGGVRQAAFNTEQMWKLIPLDSPQSNGGSSPSPSPSWQPETKTVEYGSPIPDGWVRTGYLGTENHILSWYVARYDNAPAGAMLSIMDTVPNGWKVIHDTDPISKKKLIQKN